MLAIVPARGGSQGLARKNTRNLLGKPMLAYTVEEALKSKYVSEVIVSTDDTESAELGIKYGATCPFMRPTELAQNHSLARDTYLYTIDRLNRELGYNITEFVILQPTSPLRLAEDIDNAINIYKTNEAESVISFCKERHPIGWHKYLDPNGEIKPLFKDELKNRQDYKPTYYPNGAIYVMKYSLLHKGTYFSENSFAYIMPADRSIDVDTLEDFEHAEFLLKKRLKK